MTEQKSTPGIRQSEGSTAGSTCPRCGVVFTCGVVAGLEHCWCAELPPLSRPTRTRNPAGTSCFCPNCLQALRNTQDDEKPG